MSLLSIRYHRGGVFLPRLALWLDAHERQKGAERVFISHAHSDHIGAHREVILTEATAHFMQARLKGKRVEHRLPFHTSTSFDGGEAPCQITLLPAGHIFGSAMAFIEAGGESLLYTGDFKLRPGLSAEVCAPCRADILIMETTFGRPLYQFPPTDEIIRGVIRFCREALDNDETPVLLGYSLGKSQEIVRALANAGLPVMLHAQVFKLTKIYEQLGQTFPPYEEYDPARARGKVIVYPPNASGPDLQRDLGSIRTAALTGWALDSGSKFRYQCDAIFPLSDHADFPDLIAMVKRVAPRKIYTLHGFAADFAQTLRDLGFDAQALSESEQLGLALGYEDPPARILRPRPEASSPRADAPSVGDVSIARASRFSAFAETCALIAGTPDKAEKAQRLADYLAALDEETLRIVQNWFAGQLLPDRELKTPLLGYALLRDVLCELGQLTEPQFRQLYLKHNDAGETAGEIRQRLATPSTGLSNAEVRTLIERLSSAPHRLTKQPLLAAALRQASPLEARFLLKLLTTGLRIGLLKPR